MLIFVVPCSVCVMLQIKCVLTITCVAHAFTYLKYFFFAGPGLLTFFQICNSNIDIRAPETTVSNVDVFGSKKYQLHLYRRMVCTWSPLIVMKREVGCDPTHQPQSSMRLRSQVERGWVPRIQDPGTSIRIAVVIHSTSGPVLVFDQHWASWKDSTVQTVAPV